MAVVSSFGAAMAANGLKGNGTYGSAGCGLGSMVFADQKGPIQVLAATTNNAVFPQTFALSSGISNCFEDGVALKDKEQELFANTNYESLHQEMAQGHGENLNAFASLFGCEGNDVQSFTEATHMQFGYIFPTEKTSSIEMLKHVRSMIKSNPKLQNSCNERA